MTITVNGPGGVTINFPEGTDAATISGVMRQAMGEPEAMGPKLSEMSKPGMGESALRGGMQGATFNFSDELQAALGVPVASLLKGETGKVYDERVAGIRAKEKAAQEANPGTYLAGELGGSLVVPIPGAGLVKGAATLGGKALRSAAVGAGAGAAYGVGSGEGAADSVDKAITGAAMGGAVGAALPPVAQGAGWLAEKAVGPQVRRFMGNFTPESQAARRVTDALEKDQAAGRGLTGAEFAAAKAKGEPVILADMGGSATQAELRRASNLSAEGRGVIAAPIEARWKSQAGRVADDVEQMGSGINTPAKLDKLQEAARKANNPKYERAYAEGERGIWNPELEAIANTSLGREALKGAVTKAEDYAIAHGHRPMNPRVSINPDTQEVVFKNKGGIPSYPNLQLWDYAKRELDQMARKEPLAKQLAHHLRGALDKEVPSYVEARGSAAKFFGAQDAIEFGKLAAQRKTLTDSEIIRELRTMNPAERKMFRDTFKVEFAKTIEGVLDSQDIQRAIYGSEKMRNRLKAAMGAQDAKKLEARIYLEQAMDGARKALGNSTSVQQWADIGREAGKQAGVMGVSGLGTALVTGDIKDLGYGAFAGSAARNLATRGDRKIAERVAELLASNDPKKINQLLMMSAGSPKYMDVLRGVARNLTIRGSADAAAEKGGAGQLVGIPQLAASPDVKKENNPRSQAPNQTQLDQSLSAQGQAALSKSSAAINALQRKMRGPEPPSRPIAMGIRG